MLEDGTYDKNGNRIIRMGGYQVGIWDSPLDIEGQPLEWVIKHMTRTTEEFGAWTDHATGKFWVEPCIWIEDLETAERIGRALNQISIWDWTNMEQIMLI